jgi:hypothetical protein
MPRYRNLVLALCLLVSLPILAAPTQSGDEPILKRITRIIRHLIPGSLDAGDISFPRP